MSEHRPGKPTELFGIREFNGKFGETWETIYDVAGNEHVEAELIRIMFDSSSFRCRRYRVDKAIELLERHQLRNKRHHSMYYPGLIVDWPIIDDNTGGLLTFVDAAHRKTWTVQPRVL